MTTNWLNQVVVADAAHLPRVPDASIDAIITSPPFERMRKYSDDPVDLGQFAGADFIKHMIPVIDEWKRVLKKPTGHIFLNFMPQTIDGALSPTAWLLPQTLVERGFHIVQQLTILKSNAHPQNDDKTLRRMTETVWHAVLDPRAYIVNKDGVRRPSYWSGIDKRPKYAVNGADPGDVIAPALERLRRMSAKDAMSLLLGQDADVLVIHKTQDQVSTHPARMSSLVAEWLVSYATKEGDVVMDTFCGSGTTLIAAKTLGRHFVGSDLNHEYVEQARAALANVEFGQHMTTSSTSTSTPSPTNTASTPVDQDMTRPGHAPKTSARAIVRPRACHRCGAVFTPKKPWASFCSDACRFRTHNDRRKSDGTKTSDRG